MSQAKRDNLCAPDLYDTRSNYRVPLVPVLFKVGTHSSKQYLVRKKNLKYLQPGGQLRIYSERYDQGISVLIDEVRCVGLGQLWVCQRF